MRKRLPKKQPFETVAEGIVANQYFLLTREKRDLLFIGVYLLCGSMTFNLFKSTDIIG